MTEHYPKPPILQNIPRARHTVIEASAGTGKTYVIENMVVDLVVCNGVPLEKILVLTFTERAATELNLRIRTKLEEVLFNCCVESNCDHNKLNGVWWIDEKAKERLSRALFSFDAASIGTIHSFFRRVLTEHAFDNGRLFEGRLEDGYVLFDRAFKHVLRKSLAIRPSGPAELLALYLQNTSDGVEELEQLLYRCHASRRLIRPAFSIDALRREIDASKLFEIDFEAEATRFEQALKKAKVHTSKVKAIKNRLATLGGLIHRSNHSWQVVLDKSFQEAIRYIGENAGIYDLLEERVAQVIRAIVRLRPHLVSLDAAMAQTCLPMVREVLKAHKTADGEFEYDDLVEGVVQALHSPRGWELTSAMRRRYRFALIDEFQDTDELQWAFFHRVFIESGAQSIAYLIGDPKQAIYGFRGADVYTYLAARQVVEKSGVPYVSLANNFRSTADMIDAYNHILCSSAGEPFFSGPIRYDVPVKAGCNLVAEELGPTRASPIHLLKIEPLRDRLELGTLRRALARQIALEVRRVLSETEGLRVGSKGKTELIKPSDVFVLTATNDEASVVSNALREAGVPSALYKQDGLFQTPEARDVCALLAAIDDPADLGQRGRAWITPFFAVPLEDLCHLAELPDTHPLVRQLLEWNELASQHRFEKLFNRILDDSGLIGRELFFKDNERALTNYLHIFEILLEDVRTTGCELADVVALLSAYIQGRRKRPGENGNVQRLETDQTAVQIMTVHKSKGLEAAVVFVYGGFTAFPTGRLHEYHDEEQRVLFVGDDPAAKRQATHERKLEEQRLYYVAMTRAKARLYLPLIPADLWNDRWDGGYALVNRRLLDVEAALDDLRITHLFKVVPFRDEPSGTDQNVPTSAPTAASGLTFWRLDPALFEEQPRPGKIANYREKHAGYEITSYSRMKSTLNTEGEVVPLGRAELDREGDQPIMAAAPSEGELPGGLAVGLMLHEILEEIPFDSPSSVSSFDAWRGLTPVASAITMSLKRNNISLAHQREVEAMIYAALRCKIPPDSPRSIPRLHQCPRIMREMEFLFPYPEKGQPSLSEPMPGKLVIDRGFIKGYIDLVVEYDGLVYFADWKSDVLGSYAPATLEERVATHYKLQARLYVLALMKVLKIHCESEYEARFGGLAYIFLRGLHCTGDNRPAIYFRRPSWPVVLCYEREIR
jgi:exodeoxyribonuclease V beta subunit